MKTGYYGGGGGGGGGGVTSFNTRGGAVVSVAGDYTTTQITNDSIQNGGAGTLDDALNTLGPFGVIVADLPGRNAIPASQRFVGLTVYEVDTDQIWRLIGGTTNASFVDVTVSQVTNARAGIVPAVGAADTILQSTGVAAAWVAPLLWSTAFLSPTITQTVTGSATGQTLTVQAQNAATTGGRLKLQTGTGGTTPGELALFSGTSQVASFQKSNTNDFVALGNNPASAGFLRLPPGAGIKSREFAFGSDLDVYVSGTGFNSQTFGSANAGVVRYTGPAAGLSLTTGGTDVMSMTTSGVNLLVAALTVSAASGGAGFTASITNTNSGTNAAGFYRIRAMGTTSGNTNGAGVELEGGKPNGTGLSGGIKLKLNTDDTQANMSILFQIANLATGRRISVLNFPGTSGAGVTTTQMGANTGDLVTMIGDAATVPTVDAASGHIYYSDGGKPGWKFNGTTLRLDSVQTTVGAVGAASALPAIPLGYLKTLIQGVPAAIPYYNA